MKTFLFFDYRELFLTNFYSTCLIFLLCAYLKLAVAIASTLNQLFRVAPPVMWVTLTPKEGFTADDNRYRDLVDDVIVPRFRQVQGVGQFLVSGGREREVEVIVNPKALADRNLTIGDVANTLRSNNRDIRGGPLVLGRREYRVRTVSGT